MSMDYNRFVERVRKMYPNGREDSFDLEAKEESKNEKDAKKTPNVQASPNTGENLCG